MNKARVHMARSQEVEDEVGICVAADCMQVAMNISRVHMAGLSIMKMNLALRARGPARTCVAALISAVL